MRVNINDVFPVASTGQRTGMLQLWAPTSLVPEWTVRSLKGSIVFRGNYEDAWRFYDDPPIGTLARVIA